MFQIRTFLSTRAKPFLKLKYGPKQRGMEISSQGTGDAWRVTGDTLLICKAGYSLMQDFVNLILKSRFLPDMENVRDRRRDQHSPEKKILVGENVGLNLGHFVLWI